MANGAWESRIVGTHLAGNMQGHSYCVDAEYGKVYFGMGFDGSVQNEKKFYIMDIDTKVITRLTDIATNDSYDPYNFKSITDTLINGNKIYVYGTKGSNSNEFKGYIVYTITDRTTGAGTWGTPTDTTSSWNLYPYFKGSYYYAGNGITYHIDSDNSNATLSNTYMCTHTITGGVTTHTQMTYKMKHQSSPNTNSYSPTVRCGDKIYGAYYTTGTRLSIWDMAGGGLGVNTLSSTGPLDCSYKTLYTIGNNVCAVSGTTIYRYDTANDIWDTVTLSNTNADMIYNNSFNYQSNSYTVGGYVGGLTPTIKALSYYLVTPNNLSYSTVPGVTGVQLTWTDNADDEIYYRIDRRDEVGNIVTFDNIPAPTGSVTGATGSYFDATADRANHSYTYTIRAKKVV